MSQEMDLLQSTHDTLSKKEEELEERIAKLDAEIDKRPTLEEFEHLQRENAEIISHLADPDLTELIGMARQGKAAVEEMRNQAKAAHRAKLVIDGVKPHEVAHHRDYTRYCADVEACHDVKTLYLATTSDYLTSKITHGPAIVAIALERQEEPNDVRFINGANDIR